MYCTTACFSQNVAAHSVRDEQREKTGGVYRHFRKGLFSIDNEQKDRSA